MDVFYVHFANTHSPVGWLPRHSSVTGSGLLMFVWTLHIQREKLQITCPENLLSMATIAHVPMHHIKLYTLKGLNALTKVAYKKKMKARFSYSSVVACMPEQPCVFVN